MLNFKTITLEDRPVFETFYQYKQIKNCETAFANLCAWQFKFNAQYEICEQSLVVRILHLEMGGYLYFCPIGPGNNVAIMQQLIDHSRQRGEKMHVMVDCKEMFDTHFRNQFNLYENRDLFDYVYLRDSLASLRGKHLQSKRNHVNKFISLYPDYKYINLTEKNANDVISLAKSWMEQRSNDGAVEFKEYEEEERVIKYFMDNFSALDLLGGAILIDDKMIAFTIGSKVNNETFDTHIEKAFTEYEGAFSIINRDFARSLPEHFKYINREEDLGIEGLRKAKLSYKPYEMITKTIAVLK